LNQLIWLLMASPALLQLSSSEDENKDWLLTTILVYNVFMVIEAGYFSI
jgi:hypothetical protein